MGIRGRLSEEGGVALLVAIGVMLVLTITVTSVVSYSRASARSANLSSSGQDAYALAEAGINNAMSVIAVARADTSKLGAQPEHPGDEASMVTTFAEVEPRPGAEATTPRPRRGRSSRSEPPGTRPGPTRSP